jgi:PAS domain S-box-containing protein
LHYTVVKLANGVAITARDITERKITSENIRVSEERFRSAIDSSLDAFYILDAFYDEQGEVTDFVFVDMNEVGKQQLSFLEMEVIGQQMCEILPINREQGFFERYKKVFLTGETLDDEFPISVEGYAPQWLHHTVVKLANGVAITARDVTVRKTATEKVKVSEERFRSAIDNSLDGFYILDAHYGKSRELTDFIFVDTNKVGLSFINLPPEEVIGHKLCEVLPMNLEQGFFDKYKHVFLTGETFDEEVLLQDPKLNLTWVHHTVVRLKRGIAITTRDIRLRKEHEEQISVANLQLREQQAQMQTLLEEITANEQKFRSLAENIKDVFLVFKNKAIDYVSPVYEEVWQQSVESLYNNPSTLLESIHPDDKARVMDLYHGEHYRKTGHFSEEFRLVRKDQSICWVSMRTFPVLVTDTAFHVVGIAKDVTERKASEETLKFTNEELSANKKILEEALEKLVRSESNIKALFDSSDQGIVFLDTGLRIISFNKAVNLYHSHLEQTPLELGNSIFDHLFNEAHLKDAYQDKLQACLEGKVIMFERQFNYPDMSNLRWVETSLYPVRNHRREIIGVALNEKDITAQRHIALRLRKSEIRLRGILNNTIQAFFLLDRHKSLLLCNTAATAYVFNKDLKVGEDFTNLIANEDKKLV